MKPLSSLIDKYQSYYAAGKALNVEPSQLKRLVDKGAYIDCEGAIYIKSKTKINKGLL